MPKLPPRLTPLETKFRERLKKVLYRVGWLHTETVSDGRLLTLADLFCESTEPLPHLSKPDPAIDDDIPF